MEVDITLEPIKFKELKNINGQLYVGSYDDAGNIKPTKVIKGWESFSGWYWFATHIESDPIDPESGPPIYSGLVQGLDEEFGTWSGRDLAPLIAQYKVWKIKDHDLPHAGRRNT